MWGRDPLRTTVLGASLLAFTVFCVVPLAYLVGLFIGGRGHTYELSLLDARERELLINTALIGGGTSILATAIGAPLGVIFARFRPAHAPLIRIVLIAPLLIPSHVAALAWVYLTGSRGLIARAVGQDLFAGWTYSLTAAVLVLSSVLYPLAMLATEVALRRLDGRLEEAALTTARPLQVVRRITLPLVAPVLLASALLIFVLAISDFAVPGLLQVRVYTTEVFTAFAALYDVNRGLILTTPLLLLCVGVAAAASLTASAHVAGRRTTRTASRLFDPWRTPLLSWSAVVGTIAVALPVGIHVIEASRAQSVARVLAGSGPAITNTLGWAAMGASGAVIVAIALGHLRGRARPARGRAADAFLLMLLAVPSTVIGIGLITVWNRAGVFETLYASPWMFLLGYLARFLPLAVLIIGAAMHSVPSSHEEAAAVSGARWLPTLRRVLLPQLGPAIAAAWLVVFVLACGELGVSILITPPNHETLPIRIYTLIANAPPSHVATLALLQTMVIFLPLAIASLLARNRIAS